MARSWQRWTGRVWGRWRAWWRWAWRVLRHPVAAEQRLPGPDAQALLDAAYCLRGVLQRHGHLAEISVGLEGNRLVLLAAHPLPASVQGQLRALVGGRIEIRTPALEWPSCQAADGDHCNGDYDRS